MGTRRADGGGGERGRERQRGAWWAGDEERGGPDGLARPSREEKGRGARGAWIRRGH
jgi:hypothetical protein